MTGRVFMGATWMSRPMLETTEAVEGRVVRYGERPISFTAFLDLAEGDALELVDGVLVETKVVQLTHEKLFAWLSRVLGLYVSERSLGIVLGSRTAVEISRYGGRLPDIVFVRHERLEIVREKAIYGPPDLVIELVSPSDRPSDLIALETDYRSLGVAEIVFIDQQKRRVRILRQREQDYVEAVQETGEFRPETVEGFDLQMEWIFNEPRPSELGIVTALLSRSAHPSA